MSVTDVTDDVVEIRPHKEQEKFLATPADIAVFGGAAGGGKTYSLLLEAVRNINVRRYGATIFRRTSTQIRNEGGLWDTSKLLYPYWRATPKESSLDWIFPPHRNRISFRHMEHPQNRFDWQGAQIPFIGFDELSHFTEEMFFYMVGRNRTTCNVIPYVRATTNPAPEDDEVGGWVARLLAWWIDQDTGLPISERNGVVRWFARVGDGFEYADTAAELQARFPGIEPKSLTFIASMLSDNPFLDTPQPGKQISEYRANLQLLPRHERDRLLGGNWKVRPGAGKVFDKAWFRILPAAPSDVARRVRYWDKAGTQGGGKHTAGVRMAQTASGLFVVEDVVRGQWSAQARESIIKQTAELDGRGCHVYVEQEPGSGGKESAEATIRMLAGWVVKADRPTGDKVTRAEPLAAQAEPGNVVLVRGAWNRAFLDELHGFPEGGYSDQVDAAAGAFNKLAATIPLQVFV